MGISNITHNLNIASILLGAVFFLSCSNNSIKEWNELNETTKPDIVGHNVDIIHSSEANVKFRMQAPKVIEKYKDDKPYIYICPNGIKLWQYDDSLQVNFTLVADSAYIVESKQYYELWGNIVIERKQDNTLVKTEKIIIDRAKDIVYADTPVIINKYGHIENAVAQSFSSDLAFEKPVFTELTQGKVNYESLKNKKRGRNTLDTINQQEEVQKEQSKSIEPPIQ